MISQHSISKMQHSLTSKKKSLTWLTTDVVFVDFMPRTFCVVLTLLALSTSRVASRRNLQDEVCAHRSVTDLPWVFHSSICFNFFVSRPNLRKTSAHADKAVLVQNSANANLSAYVCGTAAAAIAWRSASRILRIFFCAVCTFRSNSCGHEWIEGLF